jgi:hypothetical protein
MTSGRSENVGARVQRADGWRLVLRCQPSRFVKASPESYADAFEPTCCD